MFCESGEEMIVILLIVLACPVVLTGILLAEIIGDNLHGR